MGNMLGVMLDCSRNAVMNVETVKKYASIIRKMGYNTLMLYTEDTYEVDNNPLIGHCRGKYSKNELKELDKYCRDIGIEMIPCIQTLGHLEHIFQWGKEYGDICDCNNILLVGAEKTYKLIEDMISSMAQCFSSDKIHLGMDETFMLGKGKYQRLNGPVEDYFELYNTHLHRVCAIAEKYNLKPMIWSDMVCKFPLGIDTTTEFYEKINDISEIPIKSDLPDNLTLGLASYTNRGYDRFSKMINLHKKLNRPFFFAGGTWCWKSFVPKHDYIIQSTGESIRACRDNGVTDILMTVWGDDGSACSKFAVLPELMFAAEASRGNTDIESIKAKFKEIVGCDYDSFTMISKISDVNGREQPFFATYDMLYNDIFLGIYDFYFRPEDKEYFEKLAEKIRNITDRGDYIKMFDYYEALSGVLAIKTTLGLQIKKAYTEKDFGSLQELIKDCDEVVRRLRTFHAAFQTSWFNENKPFGFEVQDARIGGLMQRIISCKDRLQQLVNGEISDIPELDEPSFEQENGGVWGRIISAGDVKNFAFI